ncbi:MAG TPA: trimethylamine methyltransferase family protein [Candidatus Methylomirabilis sp.]|nr:trimethylamine methyltransferase family protein [Candidatus Methylomirabilis sp.]
MKPVVQLLNQTAISRILSEALQLLQIHGVKVRAPEVIEVLQSVGVQTTDGVARIPEHVVEKALESVPAQFRLFDRAGNPAVQYGGDEVHFDPGSSCLNILDADAEEPRLAQANDLVRLVQLTETLPQFAAQSTALTCDDAPKEIGDIYRLLLVLWYSQKPVVTGAFSAETLRVMLDLLRAESGGQEALRRHPRAVFDVCPSPPLNWGEFGAVNLVDLARAWVPAELISMPLAGAAAPVTLAGSVVQHAAESLSGIVIHQAAQPGAPIVWGGAPAIFDMRTGTTPMGAIETAMLNAACAEVGKSLGLPTHGYLIGSDSKALDAQAGMESGMAAVVGALSGINMISGAGMLETLACHSLEKLVLDAESIDSAQRLARGVNAKAPSLAVEMFAESFAKGGFLKLESTRQLFQSEQHLPSTVIDREPLRVPGETFVSRAHARVEELLASYERPPLDRVAEDRMLVVVEKHARAAGLEGWPGIKKSGVLR